MKRVRFVSAIVSALFIAGLLAPHAGALPVDLTPVNDDFEDATPVTSLPFSETITNEFATDQPGEPKACFEIGKTLWYRLTLSEDRIVRIWSDASLVTAVYVGDSLGALGTVDCSPTTYLAARAGETYYIQFGGFHGESDIGTLTIEATSGIAGRVTNSLGQPIQGECLDLFSPTGEWEGFAYTKSTAWFNHPAAEGVAGSFIFPSLSAGNYKLAFFCYYSAYGQEWYEDKPDIESADIITVAEGDAVLGIDGELGTAASISGTLTGEGGGPADFLCVLAYDDDGQFSGYVYTDENGDYVLFVAPGIYRLSFSCGSGQFASEFYDDKPDLESADPVTVGVDEHISGIDAVLQRNGSIAGTVTDEDGSPIQSECVRAYDELGEPVDTTYTWSSGNYLLYVPSGEYAVEFGCYGSDFRQEFYDDKADLASADHVTVTAPTTTEGISAVLERLPPPGNDQVANAIELGPAPSSVDGTTRGATPDDLEPISCSPDSRSVWYTYTPTSTHDVFLRVNAYARLSVFLVDEAAPTVPSASSVACGIHDFPGVTGFRALSGQTYLVRVGTFWGSDFTLEAALGADPWSGTFEAPTPCAFACPYWNQTRSQEQDYEATCAPEPDAPPGSWDDISVTVPAGTTDAVPTHMLFHIEPALDFDAWVCRETSDSSGRYFVQHAANPVGAPCPTAVNFGCFENATVRVQPGDKFVLRVYNWSDLPTTPGGYSFLYGEPPPVAPPPIFIG